MAMFPYDLNDLFGGTIRFLTAPSTEPVPGDISDIIDMTSPYAANGSWVDLGATGGPFQYNRNLTVGGYNIQQTQGTVLEEVTDVTRTMSVAAAEVRPDVIRMLEQGAAQEAISASANVSAQTKVPFGSIADLTSYRVAAIGRRKKVQGLVTEPGGATRGALVAWVGYSANISADNAQISVGEGDMATVPLTFSLHPDATVTDEGEEYGCVLFETAGTISAS